MYLHPERLACVARDTVFFFHGTKPLPGEAPLTEDEWDAGTRFLASYYPPEIAGPYLDDWRHREVEMRGQSLIDAGLAAECRWLEQVQ